MKVNPEGLADGLNTELIKRGVKDETEVFDLSN